MTDDVSEKMTIRQCMYKGVEVLSHMVSCWKRCTEDDAFLAVGDMDVLVQMMVCVVSHDATSMRCRWMEMR